MILLYETYQIINYLTILISRKIKKKKRNINQKLYYKYDKNKEIILNYLFIT